jgi:hypothetical protein
VWVAGSWHRGQRAFHPAVLAVGLATGVATFLGGVALADQHSPVGRIMSIISAVLFRVWMAVEWTLYFQETRYSMNHAEGRRWIPNTVRIQITGHYGIQVLFALGTTIATVIGGRQEVIWRIDPSPILVMLAVCCPYFGRTKADWLGYLDCLRPS